MASPSMIVPMMKAPIKQKRSRSACLMAHGDDTKRAIGRLAVRGACLFGLRSRASPIAIGRPCRPVISVEMLANTRLGNAASANWTAAWRVTWRHGSHSRKGQECLQELQKAGEGDFAAATGLRGPSRL